MYPKNLNKDLKKKEISKNLPGAIAPLGIQVLWKMWLEVCIFLAANALAAFQSLLLSR